MIDKKMFFLMVPLLGHDAVSKMIPALKRIFKKRRVLIFRSPPPFSNRRAGLIAVGPYHHFDRSPDPLSKGLERFRDIRKRKGMGHQRLEIYLAGR